MGVLMGQQKKRYFCRAVVAVMEKDAIILK